MSCRRGETQSALTRESSVVPLVAGFLMHLSAIAVQDAADIVPLRSSILRRGSTRFHSVESPASIVAR